jgi:hypothetical protein
VCVGQIEGHVVLLVVFLLTLHETRSTLMIWRTVLPVLLLSSLSLLVGCAGGSDDQPAPGESSDEVKTASLKTLEGNFGVGGVTGFQIVEAQGEDHNVVAVDLATMKIPGTLLVGKPLRIRGKIEMRSAGALPNGTQILREVMIAKEIVQKENKPASIKGELIRKGSGFAVVVRTPENAQPQDQDVDETALELASGIEPSALVGKRVTVLGESADKIVGVVADRFLIINKIVIATQIKGS